MKKFLILVVVALVAWSYGRHQAAEPNPEPQYVAGPTAPPYSAETAYPAEAAEPPASAKVSFACEGKTHCTEMRSCDEAKYYLEHCPWPKMDGDGDGIPCEDQWCGH